MGSIMKKTVVLIIILACLLITASSCSTRPDNILKKKVFIKTLAEFLIIEKLPVSDIEKQKLIKKILAEYKVNADQFKAAEEYYKKDDKFWLSVYKKAQERIDNKKTIIQQEVLQRQPQPIKPSAMN